MPKKPLVAGNWKMNTTYTSAVVLAQSIVNKSSSAWERVEAVLCPPFTALKGVSNVIHFDHAPLKLGAQNVSECEPGALTGEISTEMLVDLDCSYVIVGHSERRALGETSEMIAAKACAAQRAELTPIICCGEDLATYEAGKTAEVIADQVRCSLEGVRQDLPLVVAYEPIWAIGTGNVATPQTAQEVAALIRATLTALFGPDIAQETAILYGGSVKSGNVGLFLEQSDVDGVLVGGASLKADSFVEIVEEALKHA